MRLVTLAGIGALACAAVALACTDQPSAPQVPTGIAEGSVVRIHGGGTFTIHTPNGPDVHALPAWSTSAVVKNGLAQEDGAGAALGVVGIANSAFKTAATEGRYRTSSFTDDAGVRHDVVFVNSADGSPPRKVGHFANGQLVMVTEYEWTANRGGWLVASATHRVYRDGKPTSEGRVGAAGSAAVASHAGPAVVRKIALLALSWIAPADANAQVLSGPCRWEWLEYIAAQAALSAASMALYGAPAVPALYAAWLAAAAAATIAEMKLYICLQNQDSKANPLPSPTGGAGLPSTTPLPCLIDPTGPGCDGQIPDRQ